MIEGARPTLHSSSVRRWFGWYPWNNQNKDRQHVFKGPGATLLIYPEDPCMVHAPTFTIKKHVTLHGWYDHHLPFGKKKPCCCRLLHHHQPTAAQLANFGLPMCTWSLLVLQKRPKFHLLVLLSTTKSNGPFPCFCFLFCCCFSKKKSL